MFGVFLKTKRIPLLMTVLITMKFVIYLSVYNSVKLLQFRTRKPMRLSELFQLEKQKNMSKKHTLEKFGTDVERLRNMKDEDIDFSDIPPITEEIWENGMLRKNFKPIPRKNQENLPIDKDIIEFFKAQGFNYPLKINQLLRAYMEAHQVK